MSEPLFELLNRLVPACDQEFGNWQAVLTGAGIPRAAEDSRPVGQPRRRRPTRRQIITAAIAVAVVTVLFATPAFGLRALIFDFVGGRTSVSFVKSRPAPAAIKKRFLDLAIGAPAGMNPHVLPDQARQITFRGPAGGKRVLWVAPTRGGGFCADLVGAGGGCVSKASEQQTGPVTIGGAFSERRGEQPRVIEVDGHVYAAKVTTLTLEFEDGKSMPVSFVYVSDPINAGFYVAGIPPDHQQRGHWPTRIVARDAHGTIIATKAIQIPVAALTPIPPGRVSGTKQRVLPIAPPVAPSPPTQRGSADGFTVVVGHNGAVQFTQVATTSQLKRLDGHAVGYNCFRLTREFGIFTIRGLGEDARFASKIGYQLNGVGTPVDGCDIEGSGGHRWPDRNASHSLVEIALTAKGRAYFADRASARDLALFVRSARMQKIRKEPGPQLLHDMKAAYGAALAQSHIRYTLIPDGITFSETSTSGKRFQVVVKNGRIAHNNVESYAMVF